MKGFEIPGAELTLEKIQEITSDPELEHLVVWGGPLSNSDFSFLAQLPSLTSLVLGEMRIDDGIFAHIRHLKKLQYLVLAYTGIHGDFTPLAGLPLRDIRLEGCRFVGDAATRTLAQFPTLRQLEIHMTGVTDSGVSSLAGLPLETLWLGPRVTDAAMATLATMPTLRHLDICAHNVSDEGVAMLATLPNLNNLWLSRCSITDASVAPLAAMASLRELNVNHTGVTEPGLTRLRAALHQCKFPEPD